MSSPPFLLALNTEADIGAVSKSSTRENPYEKFWVFGGSCMHRYQNLQISLIFVSEFCLSLIRSVYLKTQFWGEKGAL